MWVEDTCWYPKKCWILKERNHQRRGYSWGKANFREWRRYYSETKLGLRFKLIELKNLKSLSPIIKKSFEDVTKSKDGDNKADRIDHEIVRVFEGVKSKVLIVLFSKILVTADH